jgi:hypothetical protein
LILKLLWLILLIFTLLLLFVLLECSLIQISVLLILSKELIVSVLLWGTVDVSVFRLLVSWRRLLQVSKCFARVDFLA